MQRAELRRPFRSSKSFCALPIRSTALSRPTQVAARRITSNEQLSANGGTRHWYVSSMRNDGVFWINSKVTLQGIPDGTSNTLAFGERSSNSDPLIRRSTRWAAGRGRVTWPAKLPGQHPGARELRLAPGTPIAAEITTKTTGPARLAAQGSSGRHNFAMCDGSVRFLSLVSNSDLPLLQAASSTRAGGEPARAYREANE